MTNILTEPDKELDRLAHEVIGAAIEVHRALGPGLNELIYERALYIELAERRIPFAPQVIKPIYYKGQHVGEGKLDILVDGRLILELKAVEVLTDLHVAQIVTYLKITNHKLGLLINFNVKRLADGVKRIIHST